jgi:peptide/nickel transport system substrate-binding protein
MRPEQRLCFALGFVCLLASCSPAEAPSGVAAERVVRMHITKDPASMSLIGKTDLNAEIFAMRLTDALVQYDDKLILQPLLAESWQLSEEDKTITFTLRENVRWHDGQPVTAADVLFTINKLREPETENRTWAPDLRDLTSLEAPDERTVVATYSVMKADALEAWRTPILPAHIAGQDTDLFNGEFVRHPIGCGPFKFVHYIRGQEIVMQANDDYWGGRPEIDRLEIKIFADQQTAYQALMTGDLHIMVMSSNLWEQARESDQADRFELTSFKRYSAWALGWNQVNNPFFGDVNVRKAMVLALDRESFITNVASGMAHIGATTFPPSSNWASPEVAPYGFDPDKARDLLTAAGWVDNDGDGVREKDGQRLAFTLLVPISSQQLTRWMAEWQQQSWRDVGAEVTINQLEWQAFRERRKERNFHVVGQTFHFTNPDMYVLYHSSEMENGYNFWSNDHPEIDRLLDSVRYTLDAEQRLKEMHQLQRLLHEQEPVTALFFFDAPLVYDKRLLGVHTSPLGYANSIHGPRHWRWSDEASL